MTHVERIKALYSMMVGIPERNVELDSFRELPNQDADSAYAEPTNDILLKKVGCGSTACILGWAAAYPPFNKEGLNWTRDGVAFEDFGDFIAGYKFFGIDENVDGMFDTSGSCSLEADTPESHWDLSAKRQALWRLRAYMVHADIITQARSDELAAIETREPQPRPAA